MLHVQNAEVRAHLLEGNFGLERENLRVSKQGFLAQTPDPFPGNDHIVRDFSECQVEINTSISPSADQAVAELAHYDAVVQGKLAQLEEPELLWPFSNPPYIRNWRDVPIAQYHGDDAYKTEYREYLSDRYGRYKMTFCGIHFN